MSDEDDPIQVLINSEDMKKLFSSTPEEFMNMLGQDLRHANGLISTYATLLKERSTDFQETFETGELTEDYCLDVIITKANQIDHALDILRAYTLARKEDTKK